jgi:hypothetical protein
MTSKWMGAMLVTVTLAGACGKHGGAASTSSATGGGSSASTTASTTSAGGAGPGGTSTSTSSSSSSSSAGGGGADGGGPVYPIKPSGDGRTLVNQHGDPFLLIADAPQCLTAKLSPADMDVYFSTRAQQGFNAAWVNALCDGYTGGNADGTTFDGIAPFTGMLSGSQTYDLGTPNPAFFARVDAAVASAAANGIVVFLDPAETGGWLDTLKANGVTAARSYGQFIGKRYVGADNLAWLHGNDFQSWQTMSDDVVVQAVALGIRDEDTRHLHTIELDYNVSSSLDDAADWASPSAPILGINATYTYYPTYAQLYKDYNRPNFLPNVLIEGNYEGEALAGAPHTTNAHDCRTEFYWTMLAGGTGFFYGNHDIWPLDPSWKMHLTDPGAAQAKYVQALFGPRAWPRLVPDQKNKVVTSGLGNFDASNTTNAQDNTYATTARTPDGTLVMTYMPTARAIGVDMSQLSGPAFAQWYDPSAGTYSAIAGSPLANTGTKMFTPPTAKHPDGYDDWVLVLETKPP